MTGLPECKFASQLRMIWPDDLLDIPPPVQPPLGYSLRIYQPGDEPRFFKLMEIAGWPGWDAEKLRPWQDRLVPQGWVMLVHEQSQEIAATGMALNDRCEYGQQGGEIGWIAADPAQRGKGLGMAVAAFLTKRLIEVGYRHIHLYTEDWRFAALKTYLKLGYIPFLYAPDMLSRWHSICAHLQWPFKPDKWKRNRGARIR